MNHTVPELIQAIKESLVRDVPGTYVKKNRIYYDMGNEFKLYVGLRIKIGFSMNPISGKLDLPYDKLYGRIYYKHKEFIYPLPKSLKQILPGTARPGHSFRERLKECIKNPIGELFDTSKIYHLGRIGEYAMKLLRKSTSREEFMDVLGKVWYVALRHHRGIVEWYMRDILTIGLRYNLSVVDMNELHDRLEQNIKAMKVLT